eukprot:6266544-Prymnesium_polylepis.1
MLGGDGRGCRWRRRGADPPQAVAGQGCRPGTRRVVDGGRACGRPSLHRARALCADPALLRHATGLCRHSEGDGAARLHRGARDRPE